MKFKKKNEIHIQVHFKLFTNDTCKQIESKESVNVIPKVSLIETCKHISILVQPIKVQLIVTKYIIIKYTKTIMISLQCICKMT